MVGFVEAQKSQYGAWHWALLETIVCCLDYSSDLIFAALTFMKLDLESAEEIFCLRDVVKTVSHNFFQKFNNTRCQTDETERRNFTRGFLSFQ